MIEDDSLSDNDRALKKEDRLQEVEEIVFKCFYDKDHCQCQQHQEALLKPKRTVYKDGKNREGEINQRDINEIIRMILLTASYNWHESN